MRLSSFQMVPPGDRLSGKLGPGKPGLDKPSSLYHWPLRGQARSVGNGSLTRGTPLSQPSPTFNPHTYSSMKHVMLKRLLYPLCSAPPEIPPTFWSLHPHSQFPWVIHSLTKLQTLASAACHWRQNQSSKNVQILIHTGLGYQRIEHTVTCLTVHVLGPCVLWVPKLDPQN